MQSDRLTEFILSCRQGDQGQLEGVVVAVALDHVVLFGWDGKASLHTVFAHGELFGVAGLD